MTTETSGATIAPGMRLGRYQLLVGIAAGGMGKVWAARLVGHMGFSRLVAVKTVLPEHTANADFERMFLDEARIAALVHHPNVCTIYELAEENGVLYLAMEWVNGQSLNALLKRSPGRKISHELAARIVAQAAAGLHAAHTLCDDNGEALAVVHRDVSPHNLLISIDGHVKVVDFGIAKAHGQLHSKTATGEVKGKIRYMAPEQLTGAPVDRRADIFALGCVLYEATLGRVPFEGEPLEAMYKLLEADIDLPSRLHAGYPEQLEKIVMRCLARDPNARFATAEEVRLALDGWLASTGAVVTDLEVAAWLDGLAGPAIQERQRAIRDSAERIKAATPVPRTSDPSPATEATSAALDVSAFSNVTLSSFTTAPHRVTHRPSRVARRPSRAALAVGVGVAAVLSLVAIVGAHGLSERDVTSAARAAARPHEPSAHAPGLAVEGARAPAEALSAAGVAGSAPPVEKAAAPLRESPSARPAASRPDRAPAGAKAPAIRSVPAPSPPVPAPAATPAPLGPGATLKPSAPVSPAGRPLKPLDTDNPF